MATDSDPIPDVHHHGESRTRNLETEEKFSQALQRAVHHIFQSYFFVVVVLFLLISQGQCRLEKKWYPGDLHISESIPWETVPPLPRDSVKPREATKTLVLCRWGSVVG